MNYTNPTDIDYKDKSEDWLNSALMFTRALSLLLKENEGVVIDIHGDMQTWLSEEGKVLDKAIVYHGNEQVHVIACEDDVPEGTLVLIDNEE
jgi:hypothetical protein